MPIQEFKDRLLRDVHCSWRELLSDALDRLDTAFLDSLESDAHIWLPGPDNCFAAFSVPRCEVNVVWLGESPYPRENSANGLSFYDGEVTDLFRNGRGLHPMGTSLRNILKAWFVAIGCLEEDETNQGDIDRMCKERLISNLSDLFNRGKTNGWLWLNTALSLWPDPNEARPSLRLQICKWLPLIETVLRDVSERRPESRVVLLGEFAREFAYIVDTPLIAPHPARRNKDFIKCGEVRSFLREWRCLIERDLEA